MVRCCAESRYQQILWGISPNSTRHPASHGGNIGCEPTAPHGGSKPAKSWTWAFLTNSHFIDVDVFSKSYILWNGYWFSIFQPQFSANSLPKWLRRRTREMFPHSGQIVYLLVFPPNRFMPISDERSLFSSLSRIYFTKNILKYGHFHARYSCLKVFPLKP